MSRKNFILPVIILLLSVSVNAQSNTKKNADLQKTIKDIGSLFKKKKKDSVTSTQGASQQQPGITVGAAQSSSATASGLGNAGEVLPGAKYIDVDQFTDFNTGAAIVRKGSSSALIDTKGNFIVPFNTVDFTGGVTSVLGYAVFSNGLIRYRTLDQQQWAFMNATGKTIASGVLNDLTENKRLLQVNPHGTTTYTLASGKQYSFKDALSDIREGIGIVRTVTDNGNKVLWGYRKITGESVTGQSFDEADHFSEGMAVVGKKNEFGEMKYGYINAQGKLVIPLSFSLKPSDFSGGFAKVVPKDKSDFEYAFINKSGTVVFKQTLKDVSTYGSFDRFTNYGMAYNFKYVMDTTFRMVSKKDFFAGFGITTDAWFVDEQMSVEHETSPKLCFSIRGVISPVAKMPVVGFINLATKKVVMPVFDMINQNRIYFDPVAKLAYAKVCLGKDAHGALVYREGYINEDGLFVILKGQAGSKW